MGRADLTFHPRNFTRPVLSYVFRRNDIDIYHEGDRDYSILYYHHQAELLPVNISIRNFNVRMGVRWDYFHFSDKLLAAHSAAIPVDDDHYVSYRAQVNFDSEDNWYFPTRGARFKADYAYLTDNLSTLGGHAGLSDVSASWRMSFALNRRLSLQPMLYGRLLFGSTVPIVYSNAVGGEWFGHYIEQQMPFAGVGRVEFAGRHFVGAQLQAQERITANNYLLLRLSAAQEADRLRHLADHRTQLGIQAAYYYNTMFGPVGASLGYSNKSKSPCFYINLGHEF